MTELKDKRLEAATKIAKAMLEEVRVHVTQGTTRIDACTLGALDTALRVTGADELAAALLAMLDAYCNPKVEAYMQQLAQSDARAALARYKELKNG